MSLEAVYELGLNVEKVIPGASVEPIRVGVDENTFILLISVRRGKRMHSTTITSPAEWGLLLALHEIRQERGTPVTA